MKITSIISNIINHPLNRKSKFQAFIRFLKWQISTKINPYPIVYPFTEKALLIIEKGMPIATGNLYCGLFEFEEMSFLLHFLRPDDLFIDIGSNVGPYTLLASAHVGASSISIEPVPSVYENLLRNISINKVLDKVNAYNIALGSKKGSVYITNDLDAMNHVVSGSEDNKISVPLVKLDDLLSSSKIPELIKIDVEGFETEVIKGADLTLNDPKLKAIIIETNGLGSRYGFNDADLHKSLVRYGFSPYNYDPFTRRVTPLNSIGSPNTIYLRDLGFVNERLISAAKFNIMNKLI